MCAALKFRHILTRLIWFSQDDIIRRTVFHFIFVFRPVSAASFVVYICTDMHAGIGNIFIV